MNMTVPFLKKKFQLILQLLRTNKKFRIAYFDEALDHPSLDPEISLPLKN